MRLRQLPHQFVFLATGVAILQPRCSASPAKTPKSWTLAATGDLIGDVVATTDPRTREVWKITKAADVAFFNMEGQIFDEDTFTGYPASENGGDNYYGGIGGGPSYPPNETVALASYGFNLASHANNHAWDFGEEGMVTTHKNLQKAGISFAGSGLSLADARRPVYLKKGGRRVSLVAVAGTHTPQSVAGPGDPDDNLQPRPGVSALRATPVTVLDKVKFDTIRDIALAQGQVLTGEETDITLYVGQSPIAWSHWRLGTEAEPSLAWDVNPDDYTGIIQLIETAKDNSDITIFSLHAHEAASGADESYIPIQPASRVPATYTRNISHAAIDAGADVVLIHGPHTLRGIEVYKSRPIFYGLASLTYSLGLNFRGYSLPVEWDDGIIAETKFEDNLPSQIILHPLVHNQLTNDTSLTDRAMPKIAPKDQARRILNDIQNLSEAFNTTVVIKENLGYINMQ
ncbi:hypothetical protein BHE90_012460 [Fusarium euwallaceae]|uniref:Capsule synthesis protein CapA domain-containing protein n=1 Tax=Fusarium euwallaceae TaxID=1147111 RepID=A0A430LBS8_9HYPO|nr:hypothetical protein BHE90_012460 [Fusarium euwallaceae]